MKNINNAPNSYNLALLLFLVYYIHKLKSVFGGLDFLGDQVNKVKTK